VANPFNTPVPGNPCIDDVLYWVYEREVIRLQKERNLPAPWTPDPILAKYRFCNVRRRDDKMSQWMIANMFNQYKMNDGEDLWFVSAIARYINWPPTIIALLVNGAIPQNAEDFNPDVFIVVLDDLKAQGLKVWGSAYMQFPGHEKGSSKVETVARKFLLPLAKDAPRIRAAAAENRVEALVSALTEHYGFSSFMSGQVAADLTYYFDELGHAKDLYTWAPMGPGSQRGLNRLYGKKLGHLWKQEDFNQALVVIWKEVAEQLDLDNVSLHDIQNCMCELFKYWKALNLEGSPKSTYTHETAY